MRITKKALTVLLVVALLFLPLFHLFIVFLPPVYDESFVGALDEKISLLKDEEDEKIVFVGGSSVAFGLDSELIEEYTGMPVVNFGLYAALGTRIMLDLSLPYIKEGDIVVLAPELDREALSMYFNGGMALRALDGEFFPNIFNISADNFGALLGASWDYAAEKLSYTLGDKPVYNDIYKSDSFNRWGDIKSGLRAENTMRRYYYDPNKRVDFSPDMLSDELEEYMNEYIRKCREVGAEVLFTWCPINSLAVSEGVGEADILSFGEALEEKIDARFIGDIRDAIIEPNYFYDTNFHLNDKGVILHTKNIIEALLLDMGIPTYVDIDVPAPPELPAVDLRYYDYDENEKYFEYKTLADGSYMIVGVKDEYKNERELTIPKGYDTYMVTQLGPDFLKGTAIEKIILPKGTNISLIMNGAFRGAGSLRALEINITSASSITPPGSFSGTAEDFVVYIPAASDFMGHYGWGDMGLTFKIIKEE